MKGKVIFLAPLITVALILIVGPMIRQGMFLDGLVYTSIARNMAAGIGDFWQPIYSPFTGVFYEHPPLLLFIQSVFFRLFGDTLYTEDMYNFAVFAATLFLMWKITHFFAKGAPILGAVPCLLFVLGQEVQLRYPNTLLECGMTLIILLSVYIFFRLTERGKLLPALAVIGLGSLLSFLSKGPVGLFPLVLPFLYLWMVERRVSILALLGPTIVLGLLGLVIYLASDEAGPFISQYFDQQVFAALRGEREENIASYRLRFLELLLTANLPALILCLLVWRSTPLRLESDARRQGVFFILLGCTAIFPLAISIKQAAYYQLPSLPFFCIGLTLLLQDNFRKIYAGVSDNPKLTNPLYLLSLTGILVGLVLALAQFGRTDKRDVETTKDVREVNAVLAHTDAAVSGYRLELIGAEQWRVANDRYRYVAYLSRYLGLHVNEDADLVLQLKANPVASDDTGSVLLENERVRLVQRE